MILILPGRCIVKKNTKRFVGHGRVIYSPSFRIWNAQAILALRKQWRNKPPLDTPLEMTIRFYFENHQAEADVSNLIEGPQDALKEAGVIVDDKLIYALYAGKIFGEAARTEIELRGSG